MRATGQLPAARRADISASKPSSKNIRPRRALGPVPEPQSAASKLGRASVGVAASAALVGGLAFATASPAAAAGACNPSGSAAKITKGDRGKQVRAAECLLERAGFHAATVNGQFSNADRSATKAFQSSRGLKASGNVNKKTWVALISQGTRVKLVEGSNGTSVVRLQKALSAYGKNVDATGHYGKITASRVKAIQAKYGWKRTGIAGKGVWSFLQHGGQWSKPKHHSSPKPQVKAAHLTSSSSKGLKALAYAKKQLGDPYVYGANGPGSFDCSGLTQAAWRAAGVKLPHNTNAQYRAERKVSKSSLKKGDLVFFYSGRSHVGIYAGNGKVIHAPRPGQSVQYIKMKYMPYNGAVRPA
ncbi:C40 family peptidase [Microlunatus elymi]|nr:NlpC/P60 family protein [Microlunatus elymi]